MNYKIRITAENQAIVERIADENGMNPSNFKFHLTESFFIIKENKFYVGNVGYNENIFLDYPEITTEKFIEMFDKKETEPRNIIGYKAPCDLWEGYIKQGQIYTIMQSNKHFYKPEGKNYITNYCINKEIVEKLFNPVFETLQTEQPKETDFKTKVIELIENRIAICIESIEEYKKLNSFSACEVWRNCKHENQLLLNQIKQL
jgi:hypothetical protein